MNPSPSTCAALTATETVTLSFPACITGTSVHTDVSGTYNATWTDPDPQIPTKLTLAYGRLDYFYAERVIDRCGSFPIPVVDQNNLPVSGWGYTRCVTYTVLDQNTPAMPIRATTNFTAKEEVTLLPGSNVGSTEGAKNQYVLDNNATFLDSLRLINANGPIPTGTRAVVKQVLTITNKTTNVQYPVRVNCIIHTQNDASVIDVTTTGDQSCMSY
jgi:hypothetical protein